MHGIWELKKKQCIFIKEFNDEDSQAGEVSLIYIMSSTKSILLVVVAEA